jgi:hypothetical protein
MLFPLELLSHLQDHNTSSLGQEYIINDAGLVSPVNGAKSTGHGGSSSSSSSSSSSTPSPTLVTASGSNLQIDLIWDSSVGAAPSGFTTAVIDAAQFYVTNFTSTSGGKVVLYIDVGYGEIAGTALPKGALGESESMGYLTNYATVTSALAKDGFTFTASNEPTTGQFFITSAQAKTLGLISGTSGGSTSVDGYIAFGSGFSWNTYANPNGTNSGTSSSQYDLQAVAQHELSEVMGRIGMEGAIVANKPTYTILDLFDFAGKGTLALSGQGGYFSNNNGATHMGVFNNASSYGGDIADWASYSSPTQSGTLPAGSASNASDSYDAFLAAGGNGVVTTDDLFVDAALGYKFTTAGAALA